MKEAPLSCAIAFAKSVLPQPGGPHNNVVSIYKKRELLREALFTFVGKSKTDVPSVRKFVRSKVRAFQRADFDDFYQKNMRGGHMPPSSESLKHRFSKF